MHGGFESFHDQFFADFLSLLKKIFLGFSRLGNAMGHCFGSVGPFSGYWRSIAKFHSSFVMGDSISFLGDSDILDNGESNEGVHLGARHAGCSG